MHAKLTGNFVSDKNGGHICRRREKIEGNRTRIRPKREEMCSGVLSTARILAVYLKGEPFKIAVVDVYAIKTQATEEETEELYHTLDNTMDKCKW